MSNWHDYPMGPTLRRYLEIPASEYRGDQNETPNEDLGSQFQAWLLEYLPLNKPASPSETTDLLEELTSMGMSRASIELFKLYPFDSAQNDYRTMTYLGSSHMMEAELEQAQEYFAKAQELEPGEISPYINMAMIHYSLSLDDDAALWARAGLQVEPNHQKLWEIIASVYLTKDKFTAGQKVQDIASEFNSYAGFSLAAELLNQGDFLLKAQLLEKPFESGVRDEDYLIEYSAALGLAQQFEKIPGILWQLEQLEGKKASWKFLVHVAQAFFALEQESEAKEIIARLEKNPETPQSIVSDLKQTFDQQFVI